MFSLPDSTEQLLPDKPQEEPRKKSRRLSEVLGFAGYSQTNWARQPLKKRLQIIRRLRYLLVDHDRELGGAIQRSRGTSMAEVLAAEVLPLVEACRFLEREAARLLKPRKPGRAGRPLWLSGVQTEVHREPLGVVLIIGPGNYPLFLAGCQLLQALVAGNAVVVKPGVGGGEVLRLLADLLTEAGLPQGLVQVLSEEKELAAEAISLGVDKIVFTGSAGTGRAVLRMAAEKVTPVVAELSGCDAVFVLPGADLERVTQALKFSLRWNHGETCIAPRRVFVPKSCASELEARLVEAARDLAKTWQATLGSGRAISLIQDALAKGARKAAGEILTGDMGMTPTVLTNVSVDMRVLQEDIFAPVISLVPVKDEVEALELASMCPYALGASIFGPEQKAREFAARVRAGVVLINDVIVPTADPRVPFGGRGQSGYGVTRGAEGLLELTTIKVIVRRRGKCHHLKEPHPGDEMLFHNYLQAAHGSGWWKKMCGWFSLVRNLMHRKTSPQPGDEKE